MQAAWASPSVNGATGGTTGLSGAHAVTPDGDRKIRSFQPGLFETLTQNTANNAPENRQVWEWGVEGGALSQRPALCRALPPCTNLDLSGVVEDDKAEQDEGGQADQAFQGE